MTAIAPLDRFDTVSIERDFDWLAGLDRALWLPALINSHGALYDRLAWLHHAVQAFNRAANPFAGDINCERWPGHAVSQAFGRVIDRMGLATLVAGQPEWGIQLLRSFLWHLDSLARLAAQGGVDKAIAALVAAFAEQWEIERADLEAVLKVFESLDGVASLARWSEARGVLRSEGWQQVLAAHASLRELPGLSSLIRSLGRRQVADCEHEVRAMRSPRAQARQKVDHTRWQIQPLFRESGEPDGICRSAALERVLSSEWMLSRRQQSDGTRVRRLKRLFSARLSEGTLLALSVRDLERIRLRTPLAVEEDRTHHLEQPRLQQGPIIVCLDTSSSMTGAAERVAKAVVLEAMRSAGRQRRGCLVYAFSGPGQVHRVSMGADADGLIALARMLGNSFHGGTDIAEPIESALADLQREAWRDADLLIASDGEFGVTAQVLGQLRDAHANQGLRTQGILIGDRETLGLRELCDHIYWVSDWRRFGDQPSSGASPVHDSALTRLFFPAASMRAPPVGQNSSGA